MGFAAPIWLLLLIPLAGLVLRLLRGHPPERAVPFLNLWGKAPISSSPAPRRRPPPVSILLALLAIALALVAAAGPVWRDASPGRSPLRVIVDAGGWMSARAADGRPRFVEAARVLVEREAKRSDPARPVEGVFLPGNRRFSTTLKALASTLASFPASALETRDALRAQLQHSPPADWIVTDQELPAELTERRVSPPSRPRNAGIVALSVRSDPVGQVMVRLINHSDTHQRELRLYSGAAMHQRTIELPAPGQTLEVFIDLLQVEKTIRAELSPPDDWPGDDVAYQAEQGAYPLLQPRGNLQGDVLRLLRLYSQQRPPMPGAGALGVALSTEAISDAEAAVIVDRSFTTVAQGRIEVVAHPITRDIDWPAALQNASIARLPEGDFEPLVKVGASTAVAIQHSPRRVWIGFDSAAWPKTTDFVAFWARLLDWAGESSTPEWIAHLLRSEMTTWRWDSQRCLATGLSPEPGFYQISPGPVQAFNAPSLSWREPGSSNPAQAVEQVSARGSALGPGFLLAALVCLLLAAAYWPKPTARSYFKPIALAVACVVIWLIETCHWRMPSSPAMR